MISGPCLDLILDTFEGLGSLIWWLLGYWKFIEISLIFRVQPETPRFEGTGALGGKLVFQGVPTTNKSQTGWPQIWWNKQTGDLSGTDLIRRPVTCDLWPVTWMASPNEAPYARWVGGQKQSWLKIINDDSGYQGPFWGAPFFKGYLSFFRRFSVNF